MTLDEIDAEQERSAIVGMPVESKAKTDGVGKKGKKGGKRWKRWRALFLLASLVAVIAIVFAVLQWRRADHASSKGHTRLAAARVAGQFAQILLTFDSNNPAGSLDGLQRLATPAYQPRVNSARGAAGAAQPPSAGHSTTTAEVENVYLTELSSGTAHAVTQVSWVVATNGQSAPPVEFWLQIDLKRLGGTWKVDNVNGIAARSPNGSTGGAASSGQGP